MTETPERRIEEEKKIEVEGRGEREEFSYNLSSLGSQQTRSFFSKKYLHLKHI